MGTGPRKHKPIGPTRKILAGNLQRLVARHYAERGSTNVALDLSLDVGCSVSQAQRLLRGALGASTDTIDRLAALFDLASYQLLLPNLDARNPQVVAGASSEERDLYKRVRARVRRVSVKTAKSE